MFNIQVRRWQGHYELLSQDGEVLKFATAESARAWARENIEGKSMFVVSWYVEPC